MGRKELLRRWRNLLFGFLAALAAVVGYSVLIRYGVQIPCVFRLLTGFMCPGCGNTGAAMALLRLDIPTAVVFNPMAIPEFFYIGWVLFHCCRAYLKGGRFAYRPPWKWMDIGLLASVVLWGVVRNLI